MSNNKAIFNKAQENSVFQPVFHAGNVGFVFDVDECLVEVNQHALTSGQSDILKRLYKATQGSVCFLSNNTGKTVSTLAQGIPSITEFGLVERWGGGKVDINLPDGVAPLPLNDIEDFIRGSGGDMVRFMAKEATVCFNYYNEDEKIHARWMLGLVMSSFFLGVDYKVETLLDSVEIVPRGVKKVDAIPRIAQKDTFNGKKIVMFGDSCTDQECMEKTGYGVAVGDYIKDGDYLLGRVPHFSKTWNALSNIVACLEAGQSFRMENMLRPNVTNSQLILKHRVPGAR